MDKFDLMIHLIDEESLSIKEGISFLADDCTSSECDDYFDSELQAEVFALHIAAKGFSQRHPDGLSIYPAHRIRRIDIQKVRGD